MQAYDRVDALPDYLPEVRIRARPATGPSTTRTRSTPGT